jgi:hypothetical protein
MLASKMRARKIELLAQEVGEMHTRLDLSRNLTAVYAERQRHGGALRRVHAVFWTFSGSCPLARTTARRSTVTWT